MPDLQNVVRTIEERAAGFFQAPDTSPSIVKPSHPDVSPTTTAPAKEQKTTHGQTENNHKSTVPPKATNIQFDSDPDFLAGRKVLKKLNASTHATLLILAQSPLDNQVPGGTWGRIFAELINDPVLAIGLGEQRDNSMLRHPTEDDPQFAQTEHPGLCTLSTSCRSLRGARTERWWNAVRSQFGMILMDGSGLNIVDIESILPKCSNVLFVVEYGYTLRNWAAQTGKVIASRKINSVGCIARSRREAA